MYDAPCCSFGQLMQQLPTELRNLVYAYAISAGVSLPMALALVLNAVTAAVQRTMAIKLPDGRLEPIHCIDVVAAGPESGKNSLYREVFKALMAFDKKFQGYSERSDEDGDLVFQRTLLLNSNKLQDLIEVIEGHAQSTTVALIDGGALLNSPYFKGEKYRTCEIWDGVGRLTQRDAKSRLRTAREPAVSFLAMPQDEPLQTYFKNHGKDAFEVGLLQRCSITFSSPCFHYPDHSDPRCIKEFELDLRTFLGHPSEWTTDIRGIPLAPDAERLYLHLMAEQKQARIAGAPPPWRGLQKALRKSLPIQLIKPHRTGDHRITTTARRPSGAGLEISLESFQAALAYVHWQHSQEQWLALQAAVAALPVANPTFSFHPIKRSSAEKRRLQTLEDADEIIRKLDEYASHHDISDGVAVRELKNRVGVYSARFEKALAHLVDQGFIVVKEGPPRALSRTLRRYQYGTAFPFSVDGSFGSI